MAGLPRSKIEGLSEGRRRYVLGRCRRIARDLAEMALVASKLEEELTGYALEFDGLPTTLRASANARRATDEVKEMRRKLGGR